MRIDISLAEYYAGQALQGFTSQPVLDLKPATLEKFWTPLKVAKACKAYGEALARVMRPEAQHPQNDE